MANLNLILNQPYVSTGLPTYTFTIGTAGLYNVQGQVTVPSAPATGSGAGSGKGLGSGTGGGGEGFTQGDQGTGFGGVGQGFGAGNNYQQPPAYGSNQTSGAITSSGLSLLVKKNGSTIYTLPSFGPYQIAQQFKTDVQCASSDVITVVLSSSTTSDEGLSGVQSVVSIGQGY